MAELQAYLIENGVPAGEVQMSEFHGTQEEYIAEMQKSQSAAPSAMDEKILGLLLKKFPKEGKNFFFL